MSRKYEPTVLSNELSDLMFWLKEVGQYEHLVRTRPGIMYFRGQKEEWKRRGQWVNCLLCYRQAGPEGSDVQLVGVLNHFPVDFPDEGEKAGNITIFVAPWYKRRGVGTELLNEAIRRWRVDLGQQNYTVAGAAFANAFVARRAS